MLKEIAHSNGLLSVKDFEDFDFTLLGDVHERQFMKDNIAYSGSLIQQNFGETIDNHGLIKWDIWDNKSETIDIKNEYGFITITDENILNELPKNSRIRFNVSKDYEEIKKTIRKKTNIISEKVIPYNNFTDKIEYEKEYIENINDEDIIKDTIENYEPIIKLHNEIKKECDFDIDNISENQWSIINLEFKNLFIYGNDIINKVDLNDKRGIIGILGNNAIGKSTIINIIIFALYDKISTEYNNANVLNKNSKNMYVKIEFLIGDIHYIIEKSGSIRKRGENRLPKYNTEFKKYEKGNEINLNGKDRIQTQQIIEKTIGIRDIFILCNVVSNVNTISILNMTNSNIIQMFSNLLNLTKYQDLYKNISNKLKELNKNINIENGKSSVYEYLFIEDINSKDFNYKNKILSKEHDINKLKQYEDKLNKFKDEINNINDKIEFIEKPNENETDLILKKDFLIKNIKYKISDTLDNLYLKLFKIESNDKTLDEMKEDFNKLKLCEIEYSKETFLEQKILLRKEKQKLKEYEEEILQYKNYTDCDVNNKYKDLNVEELENHKNNIKFRKIFIKKQIIKINYEDIDKLEKEIKDNEDILFFNYNELSIQSNKLKDELKAKNFYDDKTDCFKNKDTDEFLNRIGDFLNNIKNTKELDVIKKTIINNKEELKELKENDKINKENIIFNKTIDDNLKFNNKAENELYEILKIINKIKYNDIHNKIKKTQLCITKIENNISNIEYSIKYFELKELIFKIESNNKVKKDIEQLKYHEELNIVNDKLETYDKFKKVNENNIKLQKEKDEKELLKLNLEKKIDKYNANIVRLDTEIKYDKEQLIKLRKDYDDKMTIEKNLKEMNKKTKLYEEYKKLVDKKCIPTILLKEKIEYIKRDINNHLREMVNFEIDMYISEDLKFTLDIIKNGNILKAYMCSGYERFILNIMIKHSMNRYCYNNKSNLFCIDEGLDCIDDNNLKKFKIVLERLQKTYNHIILISQIDRIDKYIDHQIMIEHKLNSSYIKN